MATINKIVISGATGAIGMALVNYALEQQMQVLAICHKNSRRMGNLPNSDNLCILEIDVEEYSELLNKKEGLALLGKYDCFFHLAWQGTVGKVRNDMNLQMGNIQYTLDGVELAAALGCKCFIGAGSQAEYGRTEGKISSRTPAFPENGYGIAKLCAGQMSRIRCEQLEMKHIWARILSVYGPGDGENTLIMSAIKGFLNHTRTEFTEGMQKWDYIYSGDVARVLLGLAKWGKHRRIYCIGSGKTRLLKEYIHQIYEVINGADVTDEQLGIGHRPYMDRQVMYLQADITEWPEELKQEFIEHPIYTFEEGIRKTVEWKKIQNSYYE